MTVPCLILCVACWVASVWAYQSNRRSYRDFLANRVARQRDSLTVGEAKYVYRRFLRRKKISVLMFYLGPVAAGMGCAVSHRWMAGTAFVYLALFLLVWIIFLAVWDGIASYAYYHGAEANRALRQAKKELHDALKKAKAEKEKGDSA